ncbi:hypothetical protein NCC49_006141 [Naganishia albida]|nr:hypothetical protein NCC49_006141 [Naganishia albida]
MLMDLTTTLTINAHQEILRSRSVCARCNTRCRDRSQLPTTNLLLPTTEAKSRSATPSLASEVQNVGFNAQGNLVPGAQGGGLSVRGGIIFFDCLVCTRPIASNRYAPHLASCLGLTGASRRGTSRAAAVNGIQKSRLNSDRSTPSPYVDFDSEGSDVGSTGTGGGGRKGNKNANGKRQNNSPAKNGDYYPSSSAGGSVSKKAKVLQTYSSGSNTKTRGPSPAYSTTSSHPLAQSALPLPTASPLKSQSRDDESYASEDAEGESDDEDPEAVDYAAQSRARVVHDAGSGEDEDWEGSSDSGD